MSSPMSQEAAKNHKLLKLTDDVYAEASFFKGVQYAAIRRWFQADDGQWYRTKNGLNLRMKDFLQLLEKVEELKAFMNDAVVNDRDEESEAGQW